MKTVELELEELYFQKQKLEEKIKELTNILKEQEVGFYLFIRKKQMF